MLNRAPILCDCKRTYCSAYNMRTCIPYVGDLKITVYDCKSGTECSTSTRKCYCEL